MAEKKRVTTAPLTTDEIQEALANVAPEEFLDQFDEIYLRRDTKPETLEDLITLDDYMDQELREMFQSIIAQYVQPVASAIARIREGDHARRTANEGLEALAPILSASETLEYADITAILREIERPLRELNDGTKRRLTKREVTALDKAWSELEALVRPDDADERAREPEAQSQSASIGVLARALDGFSANDVRRLRAAGLTSLGDIADAPIDEIAQVSGLSTSAAERAQAYARGALAQTPEAGGRRKKVEVPQGWMRVSIESDVFRERLMFEYGTLGKYVEPILARLAEPPPPPPAKTAAPARATRTATRSAPKRRAAASAKAASE